MEFIYMCLYIHTHTHTHTYIQIYKLHSYKDSMISTHFNSLELQIGLRAIKIHSLIWLFIMFSHSVISNSLWPFGLQPTRLLCPWDSPGKNTGVVCHALLQGISPTLASNPGLLLPSRIFIIWATRDQPCSEMTNFSIAQKQKTVLTLLCGR